MAEIQVKLNSKPCQVSSAKVRRLVKIDEIFSLEINIPESPELVDSDEESTLYSQNVVASNTEIYTALK